MLIHVEGSTTIFDGFSPQPTDFLQPTLENPSCASELSGSKTWSMAIEWSFKVYCVVV